MATKKQRAGQLLADLLKIEQGTARMEMANICVDVMQEEALPAKAIAEAIRIRDEAIDFATMGPSFRDPTGVADE